MGNERKIAPTLMAVPEQRHGSCEGCIFNNWQTEVGGTGKCKVRKPMKPLADCRKDSIVFQVVRND